MNSKAVLMRITLVIACGLVALPTPAFAIPGTPPAVTAKANHATQVTLSWGTSSGAASYQVYRGGALLTTVNASTLSYVDSGLTPNTSYSYAVAACDSTGCSAQSGASTATTVMPMLRVKSAGTLGIIAGRFLNEGGTQSFVATVYKPDFTTQTVSANWILIGAPPGASIDSAGLLTTGPVNANQNFVVQASYSDATLTGGSTIQANAYPVMEQKGQDQWSGSGQPGQGGSVNGLTWYGGTAAGQPSTLIASLYGDGLHRSFDGGTTWGRMGTGFANYRLRSPVFVNNSTMLAGADGAGVYRSTNSGLIWSLANTGLAGCEDVRIIRPVSSSLIYLTTSRCGIFKSTDVGLSWSALNNAPFTSGRGLQITSILNIDSAGQNLLVATLGGQGLYGSSDGGQSWVATGNGLSSTHSAVSGILVQGVSSFSNQAYYLAVAEGTGVFKSTDRVNWTASNNGLPSLNLIGVAGFATINGVGLNFVSVDGYGLYTSSDQGASWQPFAGTGLPRNVRLGTPFATTNGWMYVTSSAGWYRSTDGGATWQSANSGIGGGNVHSSASDPANPNIVMAAADTVYKSNDGGSTWVKSDAGLNAAVSTPPRGAGGSIVATDSSTWYVSTGNGGVFKSSDAGANWTAVNSGLPPTVGTGGRLTRHPSDSQTLYYVPSSGFANMGIPSSHGVFTTSNGGTNWSAINGDLPADALDAAQLAVDPANGNLYLATQAGLYRSVNSGVNWTQVSAVNAISVRVDSGATPSTVYWSVFAPSTDRASKGDATSGLYQSSDNFATTQQLISGVPVDNFEVVRNGAAATLYVSAWAHPLYDGGVLRSTDGGTSWQQVNVGMTSGYVRSFEVNATGTQLLRASTMGGGVLNFVAGGSPLPTIPNSSFITFHSSNGFYQAKIRVFASSVPNYPAVTSLTLTPANGAAITGSLTPNGYWEAMQHFGTNQPEVSVSSPLTYSAHVTYADGTSAMHSYQVTHFNSGFATEPSIAANQDISAADFPPLNWTNASGNYTYDVTLWNGVPASPPTIPTILYWKSSSVTGGPVSIPSTGLVAGTPYTILLGSVEPIGTDGIYNRAVVAIPICYQCGTATSSTTTTSTTSTTTTTTATTSTTTLMVNLAAGWNLMGNSADASLDVATAFGDTSKVSTVWKWVASGAKWAFYAPSLIGQALIDYATGKGYDVLSTIAGGEGFWVNAKSTVSVQLPLGSAISSASFQSMGSGWNLIAVGDSPSPSEFNKTLSVTPPSAGDIPLNLTTLWAWDPDLSNWYFYAPSLEKNGGLGAYIQSKNYLDFGTKKLDPAMGFWVNKP